MRILSQIWAPTTPLKTGAGAEYTVLNSILLSCFSVRFYIKLGAVSIKLAAAKAIQFNKAINISE